MSEEAYILVAIPPSDKTIYLVVKGFDYSDGWERGESHYAYLYEEKLDPSTVFEDTVAVISAAEQEPGLLLYCDKVNAKQVTNQGKGYVDWKEFFPEAFNND